MVVGALDEHEARNKTLRRALELALGGRDTLCVLEAVVVAEQAEVQIRAVDFIEVEHIDAAVGGRHLLEQEDIEEPAHQRIATQVVPECRPFGGELLLHAAEENAQWGHARRGRSWWMMSRHTPMTRCCDA